MKITQEQINEYRKQLEAEVIKQGGKKEYVDEVADAALEQALMNKTPARMNAMGIIYKYAYKSAK